MLEQAAPAVSEALAVSAVLEDLVELVVAADMEVPRVGADLVALAAVVVLVDLVVMGAAVEVDHKLRY